MRRARADQSHDSQPAGVDVVSLTTAYTKLHPKLVRSYTLEDFLEANLDTPAADTIATHARQFLQEIAAAEKREFPSVGYGTDHRFKGKILAGTWSMKTRSSTPRSSA